MGEASAQLSDVSHVPQSGSLSTAAGVLEPELSTTAGGASMVAGKDQGADETVEGMAAARSGPVGEGLGHSLGAEEGLALETGARVAAEDREESGTEPGHKALPSADGPSVHSLPSGVQARSPFANHVPTHLEIDEALEAGRGSSMRRGGTARHQPPEPLQGRARQQPLQPAVSSQLSGEVQVPGSQQRYGSRTSLSGVYNGTRGSGGHANSDARGTARERGAAPIRTASELRGRSCESASRAREATPQRRSGEAGGLPMESSLGTSAAVTSAGGWGTDEEVRLQPLFPTQSMRNSFCESIIRA